MLNQTVRESHENWCTCSCVSGYNPFSISLFMRSMIVLSVESPSVSFSRIFSTSHPPGLGSVWLEGPGWSGLEEIRCSRTPFSVGAAEALPKLPLLEKALSLLLLPTPLPLPPEKPEGLLTPTMEGASVEGASVEEASVECAADSSTDSTAGWGLGRLDRRIKPYELKAERVGLEWTF